MSHATIPFVGHYRLRTERDAENAARITGLIDRNEDPFGRGDIFGHVTAIGAGVSGEVGNTRERRDLALN